MPGNGICRDPGFKNCLVRRGHSPPRAPPLGIPEPTAESLRKAVENTDIWIYHQWIVHLKVRNKMQNLYHELFISEASFGVLLVHTLW